MVFKVIFVDLVILLVI